MIWWAGPSTPTYSQFRHDNQPAVIRDASLTPSPVSQTSGEERFARGPATPGVRLSRMMMGKMGTLPPPPGPPRESRCYRGRMCEADVARIALGPPPLPPLATHSIPYPAQGSPPIPGPGSRTSSLPPNTQYQQAQARMSMLHNNSNQASRPPPTAPPPTSALPPIPSGPSPSSSHRRQLSMTSSISSSGSGPRRRHTKGKSPSLNGPPSPAISIPPGNGPPISPRRSSLFPPAPAPAQASSSRSIQDEGKSPTKSPSQVSLMSAAHPNATPLPTLMSSVLDGRHGTRQPRTPSRHLLQSALDLAQQAVEMDKGNNVQGSLAAYREAVERLKSVMERVGTDPPADGKRRTSSGKSEEEGRTLRGIVSLYLNTINSVADWAQRDHQLISWIA